MCTFGRRVDDDDLERIARGPTTLRLASCWWFLGAQGISGGEEKGGKKKRTSIHWNGPLGPFCFCILTWTLIQSSPSINAWLKLRYVSQFLCDAMKHGQVSMAAPVRHSCQGGVGIPSQQPAPLSSLGPSRHCEWRCARRWLSQ